MKAGFACRTITPPLGTRMLGFMNRDDAMGCVEIHDDLFLRALYLAHEDEQALIVGLDVCFLSRAVADRIKSAIGRTIGLAPYQILLNCSHTHAGPATSDWGVGAFKPPETTYLDCLIRNAVDAASQARDSARCASLYAAEARSTIPLSRRLPRDGAIHNAPNPDGVVYDPLPVWMLRDRASDEVICVVFSISAHPSALASHVISAEYPGAAREQLEKRFGRDRTLFLQGTAGDLKTSQGRRDEQHWAWWDRNDEYLRTTGEHLAREVSKTIDGGMRDCPDGLACMLSEIRLPLLPPPDAEQITRAAIQPVAPDAPFEERYPVLWARRQKEILDAGGALPTHANVLMHVITIGPVLRIVAVEGEPVAALGWLIHDHFTQGVTFVLGYSNGDALYLPCDRMLPQGGYEVESFREYGYPSRLTEGIDARFRQALSCISKTAQHETAMSH